MARLVSLVNAVPAPIAACFRTNALVARLARPLINGLLPPGPVEVVIRSGAGRGLRLLVDPANEKYYWTGTYETAVQRAMARILSPGSVFWDVGAHVGFFSVLAARLVGDAGSVHCFEPMARNRERLLCAIELNEFENVLVHDCALAAESGEGTLQPRGSSSMWTLMKGNGETLGVPVRCYTIQELADELKLPDLIKIDVEGAELDVLRGGHRLLTQRRCAVIVEVSDKAFLNEARALLPDHEAEQLAPSHWLLR